MLPLYACSLSAKNLSSALVPIGTGIYYNISLLSPKSTFAFDTSLVHSKFISSLLVQGEFSKSMCKEDTGDTADRDRFQRKTNEGFAEDADSEREKAEGTGATGFLAFWNSETKKGPARPRQKHDEAFTGKEEFRFDSCEPNRPFSWYKRIMCRSRVLKVGFVR